jgi:hypothetical protein
MLHAPQYSFIVILWNLTAFKSVQEKIYLGSHLYLPMFLPFLLFFISSFNWSYHKVFCHFGLKAYRSNLGMLLFCLDFSRLFCGQIWNSYLIGFILSLFLSLLSTLFSLLPFFSFSPPLSLYFLLLGTGSRGSQWITSSPLHYFDYVILIPSGLHCFWWEWTIDFIDASSLFLSL